MRCVERCGRDEDVHVAGKRDSSATEPVKAASKEVSLVPRKGVSDPSRRALIAAYGLPRYAAVRGGSRVGKAKTKPSLRPWNEQSGAPLMQTGAWS